jgi:monoamine oxidase
MTKHSSLDIATLPYWTDSASFPTFAKIDRDVDVDVVVVGGGITGLTTAYLLVSAGKSVALLERGRCAEIDTAHTTAHLTMVTDTRLHDLVGKFGVSHAQAVWTPDSPPSIKSSALLTSTTSTAPSKSSMGTCTCQRESAMSNRSNR